MLQLRHAHQDGSTSTASAPSLCFLATLTLIGPLYRSLARSAWDRAKRPFPQSWRALHHPGLQTTNGAAVLLSA